MDNKTKYVLIVIPCAGQKKLYDYYDKKDDALMNYLSSMGYTIYNHARGYDVRHADPGSESGNIDKLGHMLRCMAGCDAVYFGQGWKQSKFCQIIHATAKLYQLKILYEDDLDGIPSDLNKADFQETFSAIERLDDVTKTIESEANEVKQLLTTIMEAIDNKKSRNYVLKKFRILDVKMREFDRVMNTKGVALWNLRFSLRRESKKLLREKILHINNPETKKEEY